MSDLSFPSETAPATKSAVDYNAMNDADFRSLIRSFIEANCPAHLRYQACRMRRAQIESWTKTLSERGWIAPNWPREHGGMGLSVAKQLIFQEEFDRLGVSRAPDMGIVMLGPLLIHFGSDEQRARFLPPIARAETVWCQGYSEPNSGSDLASLSCEAVFDGDCYVVNGQKTWTTLAQDADWIFLLVRTDKTVAKQKGISFLLVDLTTPGITRRAIRTLSGEDEFCEVFFDQVRVPKENLVGKPNEGWSMAKALLGFERIFLGSPKQSQGALMRLASMVQALGIEKDSHFFAEFTKLQLDVADLVELYSRFADQLKRGETLGADVSILKLFGAGLYQRITELALEIGGNEAILTGEGTFGNEKVDTLGSFYLSRPATIYGGSNEIQRNILAKAVLDLPS